MQVALLIFAACAVVVEAQTPTVPDHSSNRLAQSPGAVIATGNMTVNREFHTATLLNTGKVLIAGGDGGFSGLWASAELYDSSTESFTATGAMTTPRTRHTATLLPDGRVLITGGLTSFQEGRLGGLTASAELYDPATGHFSPTGSMSAGREFHTATLLNDGKVLVAGGFGDGVILASAELYDPSTGSFSATGSMSAGRAMFPAAMLTNGKVLVTGGTRQTIEPTRPNAEVYDPANGTFIVLAERYSELFPAALAQGESPVTATLLASGKALLTMSFLDLGGSAAVLYDPAAGSFTRTGDMINDHDDSTGTLLPDGTMLVNGGGRAELYDPIAGTFSNPVNTLEGQGHGATLLPSGEVLLTGGFKCCGAVLITAEIFRPALLIPPLVLLSVSNDGRAQGAILHASTHRIVSPDNPAIAGGALEVYLTGLREGSVIAPQITIGGRMARILFFGNAPGYTGLNQVNVLVPDGIRSGPAVPVGLNYLSRPGNEVTIAVQ